ncbi:hypothetical protein ES707_21259 [subsurface metagenome]
MPKYRINSDGRRYILNPPRNKYGRIPTRYFKNVIIMYIIEKGKYKPSEFKDYIESLDILNDRDWDQMTTRDYPKWKHYVDRAKQQLLDNQVLFEKHNKKFFIFDQKLDKIYNEISKYLEECEA